MKVAPATPQWLTLRWWLRRNAICYRIPKLNPCHRCCCSVAAAAAAVVIVVVVDIVCPFRVVVIFQRDCSFIPKVPFINCNSPPPPPLLLLLLLLISKAILCVCARRGNLWGVVKLISISLFVVHSLALDGRWVMEAAMPRIISTRRWWVWSARGGGEA